MVSPSSASTAETRAPRFKRNYQLLVPSTVHVSMATDVSKTELGDWAGSGDDPEFPVSIQLPSEPIQSRPRLQLHNSTSVLHRDHEQASHVKSSVNIIHHFRVVGSNQHHPSLQSCREHSARRNTQKHPLRSITEPMTISLSKLPLPCPACGTDHVTTGCSYTYLIDVLGSFESFRIELDNVRDLRLPVIEAW